LRLLSQTVGKLDERSSLPLYQQLQRALHQVIETRVLVPDDALPAQRDRARDFSVSRITVRKALGGLVRALLFTAKQAQLLQAQERDPGLLVERLGVLKDGRAAEFAQCFHRGDIHDFVAELSIST
jgi:DNA-binding GntR family transcriptional regulator